MLENSPALEEISMSWKDADKARYETPWDGWYFENGQLWDGVGNFYNEEDVRLSWKSKMVVENEFGTKQNITTLKKELEKRIAINYPPKVCLIWERPEGTIEKVFNLEEI